MSRERRTHRRPIVRAIAMAGLLVALSASAVLAGDGNNGTVKIHEGATDVATTLREDAHVCTFHVHFFFADAGQAGDWSIDQAPPTGTAPAIITGSYLTDFERRVPDRRARPADRSLRPVVGRTQRPEREAQVVLGHLRQLARPDRRDRLSPSAGSALAVGPASAPDGRSAGAD